MGLLEENDRSDEAHGKTWLKQEAIIKKMVELKVPTLRDIYLADKTVSVTAGGGAIKVTITGQQNLTAVEIDPDVVDPEDVEMLQDLIVAAVNEAIERSKSMAAEQLGALTSGLGLPPGLGLG